MSKKKRPAPKKGKAKKTHAGTKKPPTKARVRAARKPGPRSQALPGMEQVRSVKLDNICEGIADERHAMNAAKQEEQALISSALQVMQQRGISVYKHGGVELARVPGAEKLRVRLVKEQGDADAGDFEPGDASGEEQPGQEEPFDDVPSDGTETEPKEAIG